MSVVNFNAVVNAHADRVWQTLSQFGRISDWHPAICSSEIEDNQPDGRPGCRRRLVLENGDVLREELLMLDAGKRAFSYRFIEAPLAVDGYVATVSLIPLSDSNETVIAWQASFEARSRNEMQAIEASVLELIASGHRSLAAYLENL
ncbi:MULTISPECIES: SRPBCC family protein [Enterobacteriaceae]|uniref:SRPBCC family protein n=1 Tax=Enterobacteriaceae TaxID=543 RepID=UPI002005B5A3|nr:SRPBCC family protein [Enterobacter cloacae]MCK6974337.1 SRPBCC family protein [Enterobacter cloacae]HDT4319997.1 SRPBCC family protein [Klebsiella aerogenes]